MMAAKPAAAGAIGASEMRIASATLAAPLAASRTATRTPARTPDARNAFAAPRFPLPNVRRSVALHRRERSSAKGTDPIRYATMMANVMAWRSWRTTARARAENGWRLVRITDFQIA